MSEGSVQTVGPVRKYAVWLGIAVLGYLSQVCLMPYLVIFGVTPNLLFALVGVVTVAYGKLRAFWLGMIYGLLMEIMCPSVPMLNLAIYTLAPLFCSFAFADKPLKTLEYERATNNRRREMPPWLRTVLCAVVNTLVYEAIHVTYIYLNGFPLMISHFLRALLDLLLTGLLTTLVMLPLRRAIFGPRSRMQTLRPAPVTFTKA